MWLEGLDLLKDSEGFLGAALDLYKTGRGSKVSFNAQQAAELALKAALNFYGAERKGYSLLDLLEELILMNKEFKKFYEAVKGA
ncbi:HEPN domain-containing protein [Candidatus Bathyarchaeota archaeon]|nr:HEPN domain-containing protein [Candidatus Bathyarchaeota archaeon]